MSDKAQGPVGDRAMRGRGMIDTSDHSSTSRAESLITQQSTDSPDPVKAWRRVARRLSDHELRCWHAQVIATLTLAEFESPSPDNDRQIIRWQLEAIKAETNARERRETLRVDTRGGYPESFIQDLKQRLPLHDLIENGGDALRKAGKEFRGNCPFHQSKSRRSLTVSPDKGLWRCHGCGKGGDHYTWICERWNVEFPGAVRILAALAGVEIPKHPTLTGTRRPKRRAVRSA